MTSSLGTCGAILGLGACPGDVIVNQELGVVGGIVEGRCSRCGLEYAAPSGRERVTRPEPESQPDFLDERGPWWNR